MGRKDYEKQDSNTGSVSNGNVWRVNSRFGGNYIMKVLHSNVTLSVRLRHIQGSVIMSNSNIDKANALAKKSGKPVAITEGDGKFYTFKVISKGDVKSFVELEEVK